MVELASPPSPFLAAASMQSFDNDFDVAAEEAERYLASVAAAMVVAPAAAATSQQQQRTQPHQPSGIGDSCLTPQQLARLQSFQSGELSTLLIIIGDGKSKRALRPGGLLNRS